MGRRKRTQLSKAEVNRLETVWHQAFCPDHYEGSGPDEDCPPTQGDRDDVAVLIDEVDSILADRAAAETLARVEEVKAMAARKAAAG